MADNKIIFAMEGVSKTFPPQKQVLKNMAFLLFIGQIGVLASMDPVNQAYSR